MDTISKLHVPVVSFEILKAVAEQYCPIPTQ